MIKTSGVDLSKPYYYCTESEMVILRCRDDNNGGLDLSSNPYTTTANRLDSFLLYSVFKVERGSSKCSESS
eukprot:scaffold9069_cov90-Cylindrotheca_fusiformis.AAC.2